MTLKLGRNWLAVPAMAGLAAFVACGVDEEEMQPQVTPVLEQTRQELWVDLYSNIGSPVTNGNVYGAANEFTAPTSCADGPGGPDLSFKWTAPQTGSYTFSTTGSALDTVLHVYAFNSTTATTLLGCNDQENNDDTLNSSKVTLPNLAAGTQIRIVVDSYEPPTSRNSTFKLNIVANFNLCPGTTNPCLSESGTWNGTGCDYAPKAAGVSCSDNNACTTGDVCNGGGVCGGSQLVCAAPSNDCQQSNGCSGGICQYGPKPNGSACSMPPSPCKETAGVCSNGNCTYVNKPDGTACNVTFNQCTETAGICSSGACNPVPKAAGTPCNDGKACTTNDVCNGNGTCGGTTACNSPPGSCYASQGRCESTGCQYDVKGWGDACTDGMGCTRGDSCNGSGQCLSGDDICSNGNMCTPNGCQPIR